MKEIWDDAWKTWPLGRWKGISVFLVIVSVALLPFVGGLMMAEGPHGPEGEITRDPSAEWLIPLLLAGASLVFILGTLIWSKARYLEELESK